jgi:putative mRNA 3-end processing factor
MEYKGSVWVVSGDYKVQDDGISRRFEPLRCNCFITESTFGLPVYQWREQEAIYRDVRTWLQHNRESGLNSVLLGYSLGKAQRLLQCVAGVSDHIYLHGAIWNIHLALREAGFNFPSAQRLVTENRSPLPPGSVIIAPPGAEQTSWMKRCNPCMTAYFSGWMQVRGNLRRNAADRGFVLSDHADWNGLVHAVRETDAQKVYVTHGFQAAFSRYLREKGLDASEIGTEFGEEDEEPESSST